MKVLWRNLSCVLCFSFVLPLFLWGSPSFLGHQGWIRGNAEPSFTTVILDPGHGGEDGGAVGKDGVLEKHLNFTMAMLLLEMLSGAGVPVVMTRTEDRLLYRPEENIRGMRKVYDLKNRVLFCKAYSDPLFLSIHMNAFPESRYKGAQIYYSLNSQDSALLGKRMQNALAEGLQTWNHRQPKGGEGIYLLEQLYCPALLAECGFLSNPEESMLLQQEDYQKELCFLLFCVIIEYMEAKNEV